MEEPTTYPWLDELRQTWTNKSAKLQDRRDFENLCASCIKILWALPKNTPDEDEQAYTRVTLFASRTPEEVEEYLKLKTKKERRKFAKELCSQSHTFDRW